MIFRLINLGKYEISYPMVEGNDSYAFDIVGESYYQAALNSICGGKNTDGHEKSCLAHLIPEPENPYDHNAVAVYIDDLKVGHLARDVAKLFKRHVGRPVVTNALIVGGWDRSNGDEGHYGVKLDIV